MATARAGRRVPAEACRRTPASPVVLVKSARTIVSLSVSVGGTADYRRRRRPRAATRWLPARPASTACCGVRPLPGVPRRPVSPTTSRVAIALQPLEVGANLGRVLIAELAILLEALGDDPFQLRGTSGFSRTAEADTRLRMASKIRPGLSPETAACRSPSRRARRRTRTDRCGHRRLAPATCSGDMYGDRPQRTARTGQRRGRRHGRPPSRPRLRPSGLSPGRSPESWRGRAS